MPAVAGRFYPDNRVALSAMVQDFLNLPATDTPAPKALIAPHAGYTYSGPIAATVYARLYNSRDRIRRVILSGPSHRVGFRGLAASSAAYFRTPLGDVPVASEAVQSVLDLPQVSLLDHAHAQEHSLEVHLPFLQTVLKDFTLVPLVAGEAEPMEIAAVLDRLWGGEETLIVVSSDLSHYLDYLTACELDRRTSNAIEQLRYEDINREQACGRIPVSGLLYAARQRGMKAQTLDLRNSGDTSGDKHSGVVGYGAYVFH
jgi:hypothetical protein